MSKLYYLCFSVNRIPDLTLTKYSVFDGSGVDNIMEKHGVFLRQLHRLGYTSGVYFHLLYHYNPDRSIPKGRHLTILFYATSTDRGKLNGIREFLTTSVLSTYYDFFCYEVSESFALGEEVLSDGSAVPVLDLVNVSGVTKRYSLGKTEIDAVLDAQKRIESGEQSHIACEIASDADVILSVDRMPVDEIGRIRSPRRFAWGAYLTKKDYTLPAQNRLSTDEAGEVPLYSILEWEPSENGRLYNVLKLMEGYDRRAVLRVDIFPVEHTQAIRSRLPFADTRRRISDRVQGKDDNSETIVKSWDKYLTNLMKFPQFLANVVAFADTKDIAVMLADSVAAEAVESGTYLVESMASEEGFDMYYSDAGILHAEKQAGNYVAPFLSLYTLEEIRPMFSFPILYPGETIECQKETDPVPFKKEVTIDPETNEIHEVISLGTSSTGYDVTFPVKLFKKHAFIAGVPGSGKTNTMLYLVTTLWKHTQQKVPFLVLEPAKQEYRALARIKGMEDLCVFSPGADTRFPLHINPFEFPEGLTLAEHIANLNAVFAGAFELIPPSPFLIDSCIEKVYLDKGWNINERNSGKKQYPTMQELYDSLKIAVEESGYEGESKANIRSVMEVRIGSLLRREIGNVYNVQHSSIQPSDWLDRPVIIELEALGEGPANFMSLLISTLIREVLKIRKTSDEAKKADDNAPKREVQHVIFYEEAHNLIGPTTDDPVGGSVDPKISATKYLVKMLAEVRALGEGIVIADQLPTAMAPEVLKNTGLKLGHRITAQDDRNLLGSTMSASAEQLEEQGTFGTGHALIFYEDLLKPFKMRVCEWEKDLPKRKYDPPTNLELFELLKENETYRKLLGNSGAIMKEKMQTEFGLLRTRAGEIRTKIRDKHTECTVVERNLSVMKGKLARLTDAKEIEETQKHISTLKKMLDKRQGDLDGPILRDLTKLCRDSSNLYFAYITLSKNYYVYSEDMYACTISNYLSLFSTLKSLHDVPKLSEVLMKESADAIKDICAYMDLFGTGADAILADLPFHDGLVFDSGYYLINRFDSECRKLVEKVQKLKAAAGENERGYAQLGREFTETYFRMRSLSDRYLSITQRLSEEGRQRLKYELEPNTDAWVKVNRAVVGYEEKTLLLHKAVAAFVIDVFKCVGGIDGLERKVFLEETVELLASFRSILDYRDKSAETVLSGWSEYAGIWNGASTILALELNSRFANLDEYRRSALRQADGGQLPADVLKKICMDNNSTFWRYAKPQVEQIDYRRILVNRYTIFLASMLRQGSYVYPMLAQTSRGNWAKCSRMIRGLMQDDRISKDSKEEWAAVSNLMKSVLS